MRLHGSITQLHYPLRSDTTNNFLSGKETGGRKTQRHKVINCDNIINIAHLSFNHVWSYLQVYPHVFAVHNATFSNCNIAVEKQL